MHEVSLCESIIRIIEAQAQRDHFSRVEKVTLAVGTLSGASAEALTFCFPMVAKNTIADGATLQIKETNGPDLRVCELEVGGT